MKKIILTTLLLSTLVMAQNSFIYKYSKKDFSNSATKLEGKIQDLGINLSVKQHQFSLGYINDKVDREHYLSHNTLESLDVKKYNLKYENKINEALSLKANYIKIIDNLAPTDQGKIYGLGAKYNINKGLELAVDLYKSDYKTFDVHQYDFSLSKKLKIDNLKVKVSAIVKSINIDGEKYGSYSFDDKDYLTAGLKVNANYNSYLLGAQAFFGKRVFTVFNDGTKVQHHAMEQDKRYMISLGKKFKDFDVVLAYLYQNGKELPENKDDVDTSVTTLAFKYNF
ncbi:hypothetical protein LPB137_12775 [Poseidonibacter parvus]|uniref:DUF481 domain-containing protein n=1 Tax=Poseidonibacter parvus TaxID=1850254 RepID=A0A1P8KQ82_9BACT|nr:hypothetical protein [Poseidonibacter parvus]APW66669.1 hypothetical protein LPB137_12775 [Poseidonibacter parvus]